MEFVVYIIWSPLIQKLCVGQTENLTKRLSEHRNGESGWTKQTTDWELVRSIPRQSRKDAIILEKKI